LSTSHAWNTASLKDKFCKLSRQKNDDNLEDYIGKEFVAWYTKERNSMFYSKPGVVVGNHPSYKDAQKDFNEYGGRAAKTRELTEYIVDLVIYRKDAPEVWPVEVEVELNYWAIGQALSYYYAFKKIRDYIALHPEWQGETQEVAVRLQGKEIIPTVVCYFAPIDQRVLCQEIHPPVRVFYCLEGHLTDKKYWAQ